MSDLITLVDLLQPVCTRTYGSSPCTASLGVTGTAKCYNTRGTCQDQANYAEGTLTLRFGRAQEGITLYGTVLPCLTGISITPLSINIGGMDQSMSPFGRRESVQLTMSDFKHSDLHVDPYRLERPTGAAGDTFDPYLVGSFWGKWVARNPYFEGMELVVRQGVYGDALIDMEARHYVITGLAGPNDGVLQITAKDLFSLVENRKGKAPEASRGELKLGFTDKHTGTFEITPADIVEEDYPEGEFYVAISDEIIRVSRGTSSAVLQILERGALESEVSEHDTADRVQRVLHYDQLHTYGIVYDLLTTYTVVDASQINYAEWAAEMATRPELLSAWIAEPTAVEDLIGELAEQVGFTIWPSTTENQIKLKVLQPDLSPSPTINDRNWIVQGSYGGKVQTQQRISQVWVYYGQRNPLADQTDAANYRSRRIFADLEAETLYGAPAIRQVFSRWIPQYAGAFATTCGNRLLTNFRDPPLRCSFQLHHRRAGELAHAEAFLLEGRDDQTALGVQNTRTMVPFEMHRIDDRIVVQAQQIRFYTSATDTHAILIETDTFAFDMRATYESLYGVPAAGQTVTFTVMAGIKVGSHDPAVPAMRTGSWPAGTDLSLVIQAGGKILGAGGDGGNPAGTITGQDGGNALEVEAVLLINNGGTIGGGGGGGGGGKDTADIYALGGGGAGKDGGTGNVAGNETTGGDGGTAFGTDPVTGQDYIATGGRGGDLGQYGEPGSYGGNGGFALAGDGGLPGNAIVGSGYVFFTTVGTIVGDVADTLNTEFDPPPEVPDNVALDAELALVTSADYTTTMVLTFDMPDDDRVVSFEAQVQTARYPGTWKPLFDAYLNRYEWPTSEIGVFRVRVRTVYVRGVVYSAWVTVATVNNGSYAAMYDVGLAAPLEAKLFATLSPDRATARLRVQAKYDSNDAMTPDRLLVFYSVLEAPNRVTVLSDTGTKLYIKAQGAVLSQFTMDAGVGSTTSVLKYQNNGQFDPDLVGYWWVNIDDGVSPYVPFLKVADADSTTMRFAPGDAFPYSAASGDTINVVEAQFSDSRTAEFRLIAAIHPTAPAAYPVEVIKHNGVQFDVGGYYLEVEDRGAEGTTQADQTGREVHYFPAPGPLTNIIEIPVGNFGADAGMVNYSGDVPVVIPSKVAWLAISCCFARRASEGSLTKFVRSPIVPLTLAGPA